MQEHTVGVYVDSCDPPPRECLALLGENSFPFVAVPFALASPPSSSRMLGRHSSWPTRLSGMVVETRWDFNRVCEPVGVGSGTAKQPSWANEARICQQSLLLRILREQRPISNEYAVCWGRVILHRPVRRSVFAELLDSP